MNPLVETEGNKIHLTLGNVRLRVDRLEFVPAVLNFVNGGSPGGERYILETEIIEVREQEPTDAEG